MNNKYFNNGYYRYVGCPCCDSYLTEKWTAKARENKSRRRNKIKSDTKSQYYEALDFIDGLEYDEGNEYKESL